jgi:hypothetical protein
VTMASALGMWMLQRFGLPSAHGLNGYSVGIVLVLAKLNTLGRQTHHVRTWPYVAFGSSQGGIAPRVVGKQEFIRGAHLWANVDWVVSANASQRKSSSNSAAAAATAAQKSAQLIISATPAPA